MSVRRAIGWALFAVVVLTLDAGQSTAGPFRNKTPGGLPHYWGWRTRTDYSPLHYWAPGIYAIRAYHHPRIYAQYTPGPEASIPPIVLPENNGDDTGTTTGQQQQQQQQQQPTTPGRLPEQLPPPVPVEGTILMPAY